MNTGACKQNLFFLLKTHSAYFKQINMLIRAKPHLLCFLIIFFLFHHIPALSHLQQTTSLQDRQFEKLNNQQKSLQDKINTLLTDITNVQKSVSQTPNGSEKVMLLQKAIISEREKVFNIQNELIPPFSFSKTACLQLTNEQKIDMLDKIKTTKQQLTNLQKQILTAPKCDKITGLQKDTQKQITLLESLQKTIYTECQSKSVLTPTIYQTNIYADGWILGQQDIDDLIEEYYQRNIRYHNITNCPLELPFFNGQKCIICKDPEPVFNILTRQCTHCPQDQQPDSNLRQCGWRPHYTDFNKLENWAQDGAPMPVPAKQLVPCPPQKPYYNGKKCQSCLMPKYWSIKKNACVQCSFGNIFDVNDKKCQKPEKNDLTILQGTRWVTNDCNLTRIIDERVKTLSLNKTSKDYKMCPTDKPFYDGIVCISCPNEFNIDTRKCVSSSNKLTGYNQNVRCYVEKQSGFETDPRASKYTSKTALKDTIVPNCKQATPYYDGIACINCLQPFSIFDVDTRRCTACDPMEIYNKEQHKCIARPKIYISNYENTIMATPKMSIDDYHAQIGQKIKDNPDAIILLCQNTEYSDYKSCFNCSEKQYFNIETKKCQICDGTLNSTSKVCAQKLYLYTNLNGDSVKRIFAVPTTIQQENNTINSNLKLHPSGKLCPVAQPYYDGKSCTNCTGQSFNLTSNQCIPFACTDPMLPFYNKTADKCQQCPKNQRYSDDKKTCLPIAYVTNTNAMFYYIQEGTQTKDNLDQKIYDLQGKNVVISCDASHPYWNGTDCIDCAISREVTDTNKLKPFFNLKTLTCVGCKNWDSETKKCNDTTSTQPKKCAQSTPYLDPATNQCTACKTGTVFIPSTAKCQPCPSGQTFNSAKAKCECPSGQTLNPATTKCECPSGQSYNSATLKCESCPTGQIFNSKTLKCQPCGPGLAFNAVTLKCEPCPSGSILNAKTSKCQQCPQGQIANPSTNTCQSCQQGQIFNPKTSKCQTWVTNVSALTNNYIEQGTGTKPNLNATVQKIKSQPNVLVCPTQTPIFSKSQGKCIKCSDNTPYWNILKQNCVACDNYNASTRQCDGTIPRFDMSIEDFYGTIFGA